MKSTIVWHGDRGTSKSPHTARSVINGVTDKAAAVTLAGVLDGFSTCNRGRASVVDYDAGTPEAPGVGANVDEKGTVFMKDTATDSTVSVEIPSWDIAGHPLEASSEGDRLAAADVTAIAGAISTATGKTLVGLWGKHTKRS